MKNNKYSLTIGWLYPELMSTYGDRGNIIVLQKRCEWRGIEVEVKKLELGFNVQDLKKCDLLFMGGAQDRQQTIVSSDLKQKAQALKELIEQGIPGLYICGAYQFLGKYYKEADGTIIDGLGILDLYTENPGVDKPRLIGNVVVEMHDSKFMIHDSTIVGFENHGGRTYLGEGVKAMGEVITGFGNNGEDKTEGAIYKNSIGSYLHGPILPKNPQLADFLIYKALEKKYKTKVFLNKLMDAMEWQAHTAIVKRLGLEI